jgi:hypothetical protein
MPARRLTDDERSIRRSRGIAIVRLLPFLLIIVALLVMSADQQLFQRCIGKPLEGSSRAAAWVRLIVSIPCSPNYVRDSPRHWLTIATFCVGVGFAIPQVFWLRRHKAYWDPVREKQRLKRAELAAEKKATLEIGDNK